MHEGVFQLWHRGDVQAELFQELHMHQQPHRVSPYQLAPRYRKLIRFVSELPLCQAIGAYGLLLVSGLLPVIPWPFHVKACRLQAKHPGRLSFAVWKVSGEAIPCGHTPKWLGRVVTVNAGAWQGVCASTPVRGTSCLHTIRMYCVADSLFDGVACPSP